MLELVIKALKSIYPEKLRFHHVSQTDIDKLFPLWIVGSIDLHEVLLTGTEQIKLQVITIKKALTFDQVVLIFQKASEKFGPHLLLVADKLPAKYRPLLVRSRIPYVYKDKTLYAPSLGLKINDIDKHFSSKQTMKRLDKPLSPFSLKLIAGILTDFIPKRFSLKNLHQILLRKTENISIAKLSLALNELAEKNLLQTEGAGPRKTYVALKHQETWPRLKEINKAPFYRAFEHPSLPSQLKHYCSAGETALAHYSMLVEPPVDVFAVAIKKYRLSLEKQKKEKLGYKTNKPCVIQIWKEDPLLFSKEKCLNPIELYFSFEHETDERIRKCLGEMLRDLGLEDRDESE